jgi:hypothetical protein
MNSGRLFRSRIFSIGIVLLLLWVCVLPVKARPQPTQLHRAFPIFIFHDDEFWLNLHHFLYVLGRAENKTRDSARAAVSGAPADEQRGFAVLSAKEQGVWKEAVTQYATGLSKKDLVFDDSMPAITAALARAREGKLRDSDGIDPSVASVLMRVAPLYRKAWWPTHHAANKAWRSGIEALVKQYGTTVLSFITHAYEMEWTPTGFHVHLTAYANWAGAYSTHSASGDLLVVSSMNEGTKGPDGLETVFHEGMHQWDDLVAAALQAQAQHLNQPVPRNLSHALIFFTAGDAVHRVLPEHVPYADKFGVWQRGMLKEREVVNEIWKPYLDGHGTRDEAFAELIKRLNAVTAH